MTDIVDFEYLLGAEASMDSAARWNADRALYEAHIATQLPNASLTDRNTVFRAWLDAKRMKHSTDLPGENFTSAWKLLVSFFVVASLLVGALHAGGTLLFLESNGHVSPTKALFWTVGFPLALTFCGVCFMFGRRALHSHFGGFSSVRLKLLTILLRRVPWRGRVRLRATLARLDHRDNLYRALALGHVVFATQICYAVISLGILASAAYHFYVSDVRFGWSSTGSPNAYRVSHLVEVIALPWSWVMPSARPTLAQVTDSSLDRRRPDKDVNPDVSWAWAKFLMMSIVVYGVVLRLVLAVLAARHVRVEQAKIEFIHPDANALWLRLTTPNFAAPAAKGKVGPPLDPRPASFFRSPIDWYKRRRSQGTFTSNTREATSAVRPSWFRRLLLWFMFWKRSAKPTATRKKGARHK